VIINFDEEFRDDFVEIVYVLQGTSSHHYAPKKMDMDLKNRQAPLANNPLKSHMC